MLKWEVFNNSYVINQHNYYTIKDYPHVDHQIKIYVYFQYIKTCLWLVLVFFFCDEQKILLYHAWTLTYYVMKCVF